STIRPSRSQIRRPDVRTKLSLALVGSIALALGLACKPEPPPPPPPPPPSPVELEAKNRGECHVVAVSQSQFDPTLAEEPARTISETHKQGGDVVGSGAIAKGAAKGATG